MDGPSLQISQQDDALGRDDRPVVVSLVQASSRRDVVGRATGRADAVARAPSPAEVAEFEAVLQNAPRDSHLTLVAYHPGARACVAKMREFADDTGQTVVTLLGPVKGGLETRNRLVVCRPGLPVLEQDKLSLDAEDEAAKIGRGDVLNVFRNDALAWAVLNCHDFSHVDVVLALQKQELDLIVVVSDNPAARLFGEYALADIHRLFCFVVIANAGDFGGSGVFAPFRRIGREDKAQIGAAGRLFATTGSAKITATFDLDVPHLREMRRTFRRDGLKAKYLSRGYSSEILPIAPSEHVVDPRAYALWNDQIREPKVEKVSWPRDTLRIAVAQLYPMSKMAYLATRYRIHQSPECAEFERLLDAKLDEIVSRCRQLQPTETGGVLDMLVLPEVLVPRTYEDRLIGFSRETGAIVVAGLGYHDDVTANECCVILPGAEPRRHTYRKITRSQYDGRCLPETDGFLDFLPDYQRGQNLLRFEDDDNEKRGFGVLVCFDYSHHDIVHAINCAGRTEPLELLVVVANNPFGMSYRSACISDSNRFYQYVAMCNVATYGGTGLFGPKRVRGARQVIFEAGQGAEGIFLGELELRQLRSARREENIELRRGGDWQCKPGVFQCRYLTE